VCRRRSSAAAAALSFRRRLAAQHALTISPPPSDVTPDDVTPEALSVAGGHVTPAEVERVRLFYSSLGSRVVVCGSLAYVSVGSVGRSAGAEGSDSVSGCCWVCATYVLYSLPMLRHPTSSRNCTFLPTSP